MTREELVKVLKERCVAAGSARAFAEKHGVLPSVLSEVLSDKREPSDAFLDSIGFERTIAYAEKVDG